MLGYRDSTFARRPVVMSTEGIVAAGHPLGAAAGLEVLQAGGNAVDAAIASAAVMSVVRPTMGGPGGDVFMLIRTPGSSRPVALNGSGAAPLALRLSDYADGMPEAGIHTVSVPGAVDAWATACEQYGSMTLARLFQPAIRHARNGIPTTEQLARRLARDLDVFSRHPESSRTYLSNGSTPKPGSIFRQPDLAATYEAIGAGGRDLFYRGEIARRIVETSEELGGALSLEDFARHATIITEPATTTYRDLTVSCQPPVSQGVIMLEALNILEQWDRGASRHNDADAIHRQVEAIKLAFYDKQITLGDPAFVPSRIDWLLDKARARELAVSIEPDRASPRYPAMARKDTTYLTVVDRTGMAVSHIQSLFHGSGIVARGTGFQLNARMNYFSLDDQHPNCLAPGKRTVHTLTNYMAFTDDELVIVGGSPGGDGQTQTNLQVFTNLVDYGLNVQDAIEAPRWVLAPRGHEEGPPTVCLEASIPAEVADELQRRGHRVEYVGSWTRFGGAQAIVRDPATGILMGGADPRREGYAIGY